MRLMMLMQPGKAAFTAAPPGGESDRRGAKMNILLWIIQLALALLYLSGGAYKTFMFDELAGQMNALPRGGWRVLGVVEMLGAVLLIVPAAAKWMPVLTPVAAVALALETLGLSALYANYSLEFAATNPLVWSVAMGLLVAFVAYGRYALTPPARCRQPADDSSGGR